MNGPKYARDPEMGQVTKVAIISRVDIGQLGAYALPPLPWQGFSIFFMEQNRLRLVIHRVTETFYATKRRCILCIS